VQREPDAATLTTARLKVSVSRVDGAVTFAETSGRTSPDHQYIGEHPDAPITFYVYSGADGRFSLYDDDGATYGYERGEFARIPVAWNDATRTLTIGARRGRYPGMAVNRLFTVVLVTPGSPKAYGAAGTTPVPYTGAAVAIRPR
jgi:alpha-D-xyloside xylohydrolase